MDYCHPVVAIKNKNRVKLLLLSKCSFTRSPIDSQINNFTKLLIENQFVILSEAKNLLVSKEILRFAQDDMRFEI